MANTDDEMFKAVLETGQTALKSSLLINGGAAAALLAVIAEGLKSPGTQLSALLSPLAYAWLAFMLGLGLAGAATGFRYLSQDNYATHQLINRDPKFDAAGDQWKTISMVTAVSSFLMFFAGAGVLFAIVLTRAPG